MRRWLGDTVGGLPGQFWYLWAGTLINRLGSFVLVFLAIYLHEVRGFSASFTGLTLGLYSAGGAAGVLVGGALADRWGRRSTLLLAQYSAATLMLVTGLSTGRLALAVVLTALGFAAEMARPAFGAMMIDVVPDRDRLRAFSLNYWAINLGFAVSTVVAGFAAQASFVLLFAVDAASTAVTATIIALRVRESRPPTADPTPSALTATARPASGRPVSVPRPGLGRVFTDRVFVVFVVANMLTAMVFLQHLGTLPLTMSTDGLSTATYGLVMSINGILIVAGQLFIPKLVKGRDTSATLALAVLICGLGFGLTAFAHTAGLYALTVLIWTLGEMLNAPANSTLLAELAPADMRGRYQGVFSLSWQLAGFAAPVFGGLVLDRAGGTALWTGCFVLTVLLALAHRAAAPTRARRVAELAAQRDAAGPNPPVTPVVPGGPVTPVAAVPSVAEVAEVAAVTPDMAVPERAEPSLVAAVTGPASAAAVTSATSSTRSEP